MRVRPLAVMGAACALLLSACGGGDSGDGADQVTAPEEASGSIVLSGWASTPAESKLLQQALDQFKAKYPKVTVDYQPVSGDYPQAMLAKFSARQPPDVFYFNPENGQDWIKQQLVEPLDDYVAKANFDTSKFLPNINEGFKGAKDGKLYGLSKDFSPLAMYANTDMLKQAGVTTPPATWEELRAAAQKIKVPGGSAICLSPDWARALAFVYQNGGELFSADLKSVNVDTPETKEALDYYVGLVHDGLAEMPTKLGVGWCGEALGKGKAAIVFEGNWLVPPMKSDFPKINYAIYPMVKGKQAGNIYFTNAYSMAADSKNKNAAWTLIQYLTGPEGMKTWTSGGLALPSRSDVQPAPGMEVFIKEAEGARPWVFPPGFSNVRTVMGNELTSAMEGKTSVEDAVKKVSDEAQAALSK